MEAQLNTFEHWAKTHLSEEDAQRYFENIQNEVSPINPKLEVEEEAFIYSAFVWEHSKEGHNYWMNIQNDLEKKYGWEG
jgi:hemerythrin-like domain-containing protein